MYLQEVMILHPFDRNSYQTARDVSKHPKTDAKLRQNVCNELKVQSGETQRNNALMSMGGQWTITANR